MKRCTALVYKRDRYRRTGRSKGGFEMHYTEKQCERQAKYFDGNLCWQHLKEEIAGRFVMRCSWAFKEMETK